VEPVGAVNGLVIDCADPLALAAFWGSVFATEVDAVEDEPPDTWTWGPPRPARAALPAGD
jgi:hypothetical protein